MSVGPRIAGYAAHDHFRKVLAILSRGSRGPEQARIIALECIEFGHRCNAELPRLLQEDAAKRKKLRSKLRAIGHDAKRLQVRLAGLDQDERKLVCVYYGEFAQDPFLAEGWHKYERQELLDLVDQTEFDAGRIAYCLGEASGPIVTLSLRDEEQLAERGIVVTYEPNPGSRSRAD